MGDCCLLFVVVWLLVFDGFVLFVGCCVLCYVCCLLFVVCWFVVCSLAFVV